MRTLLNWQDGLVLHRFAFQHALIQPLCSSLLPFGVTCRCCSRFDVLFQLHIAPLTRTSGSFPSTRSAHRLNRDLWSLASEVINAHALSGSHRSSLAKNRRSRVSRASFVLSTPASTARVPAVSRIAHVVVCRAAGLRAAPRGLGRWSARAC